MSDNIPFEIQVEIIKRLPIKSLIQVRSVSKAWKSLIDGSDFIARYNNQQHHLFLRYADLVDHKLRYASLFDDDDHTFPQQKFSPTLPPLVESFKDFRIIGSSNGLLCFRGDDMVVLWNISIRKSVAVIVPNVKQFEALGFGVCPRTNDPKIVKIRHTRNTSWEIEVFTLSTGAWKSPYKNLPRNSITFGYGCRKQVVVVVDGFLYWLAIDTTSESSCYNLIVSFDLTTEEFKEVNLPDSVANDQSDHNLYIYNLMESIAVIEHHDDGAAIDVWVMEDVVSKSFTKLYTIYTQGALKVTVLGFRKSGESIIEIMEYLCPEKLDGSSFVVYDPYSKDLDSFGIPASTFTFHVYPYIETLLLLDQPDSVIYDQGKRSRPKKGRAKKRRAKF